MALERGRWFGDIDKAMFMVPAGDCAPGPEKPGPLVLPPAWSEVGFTAEAPRA